MVESAVSSIKWIVKNANPECMNLLVVLRSESESEFKKL